MIHPSEKTLISCRPAKSAQAFWESLYDVITAFMYNLRLLVLGMLDDERGAKKPRKSRPLRRLIIYALV